jgi:hypothetical protein
MDTVRGFEDRAADALDADNAGVGEVALDIGGDERRMHVRAYNHWVSLLRGRAYPSIEDLDPANIADFGAHSVLLDFSAGIEDPTIAFLGRALREECGLDQSVVRIADVPARSLLSRLTDHYLQIIANRAPIGFEAEFVGTRGHTTLYRGILMPFSSDEDSIDFIYGVINWKEMVDPAQQASLDAELEAAVKASPKAVDAPVWADGPSAAGARAPAPVAGGLADRLMLAQESAAAARASDTRSRAALYRALGRAHDFALAAGGDPDGLARLFERHGIAAQARAPMTPIVKLVFGADYDKTRVTEFAAVLTHAAACGVPEGGLPDLLEGAAGGIKAIVAEARAARRAETPARPQPDVTARAAVAQLAFDVAVPEGAVVVLVARAGADGMLDILGAVDDAALAARAARKLG